MNNRDRAEAKKAIIDLISLSKDGKIEWDFLEDNKEIVSKLELTPTSEIKKIGFQDALSRALKSNAIKFTYDEANSFFTIINNNYILLLVKIDNDDYEELQRNTDKYLYCLFVPSTFKNIVEYKQIEIQEISRLLTIIKNKFPSVSNIFKDINFLVNTDEKSTQ